MAPTLRAGFAAIVLLAPGLHGNVGNVCRAAEPSLRGKTPLPANSQAAAVEALDGGRADEAVRTLEKAVAEDPAALNLLDLLGKAYLKSGREFMALEVAERIIRAFPDRHSTRLWLAQLLERQGRLNEARAHYRVLVFAPDALPEGRKLAAIGLARSHLRDGEHFEAWQVMLGFMKSTAGGDAIVARLRSLEPGPHLRAIDDARRAFEGSTPLSQDAGIIVDLARVFRAGGDSGRAIRLLEQTIRTRGALGEPAGFLGELYLETGREREALELAEAYLREVPGTRFAEVLRLRALSAQNREDEGLVAAERLLREHGAEREWLVPVLETLLTFDRPLEALKVWRRVSPKLSFDDAPLAVRLFRKAGGRALADGDSGRAVELIRAAHRLAPSDPPARRELGWAELSAGNPAGALTAWRPLLESPNENAQLQSAAVKALRALGEVPAAFRQVRRALREDPENPALRKWYWALLEETGRTTDLLQSLDPGVLPASDPAVGSAVATILGRRRQEPAFRALLDRWLAKLPADPYLLKAHAKAVREEQSVIRISAASTPVRSAPDEPEARSQEEALARLEAVREGERLPAPLPASPLQGGPPGTVGGESPTGFFRDASLLLVDALLADAKEEPALAVLEEMVRRSPGEEKLLVRLFRTASLTGRGERAVKLLENLQSRSPDLAAPRAVLISRALARQDLEQGRDLLERYLNRFPGDADKWFLLGELELDRENPRAARRAFRSAYRLSPDNIKASIGLALAELELENYREALALLDPILLANPHFSWARTTRIKALYLSGDEESALKEWDQVFETFPNDDERFLLKADLFTEAERYRDALAEIQKILDLTDGGALPVLLYHGISANFESDALSATLFRDQLRALRDAGYVTVGLAELEDWMEGRRPLPPQAMLLTFDDARLDNLLVADPILEEFGMRAVQFVPTGFVKGDRSFYMSWSDLRKLAASGRWEFGAHGHLAHKPVTYQASGTRGNFLVTRRWIPESGRNETVKELEERLREDYWLSQKRLEEELGLSGVAVYAFPFGSFGQRDLTNEPSAGPLNLRLLEERFRVGFFQNEFGYNLPGKGPLLCRFSVPETWDGKRLLAHLRENHPRVRGVLKRSQIYSYRGHTLASLRELRRAEELGASPRQIWKTRGRTLLWRGDKLGAITAFQQLVLLDPTSPQALQALEEAERPLRPSASLRLWYSLDQEDREIFQQFARGEVNVHPRVRLHAELGHARYSETHQPATEAAIGEVGALVLPHKAVELEAAVGEHWFDGATDKVHYSGAARGKLLDLAELEGGVAGGPVQTPRGVQRGIRLDAQFANAFFNLTPDDGLGTFFQHGIYSDSNVRDTFRLEYSHRIVKSPQVRLGVDSTVDDTRNEVPEYYSPDDLHLHRLFVRMDNDFTETLRLTTRLAGGYGWEDGHGRPVASALLRLHWMILKRLELSGDLGYLLNPHYWEINVGPALTLHF